AAGGACAGALVGAYGPQHSGGQMLLLLTLAVLSVLLHRLSTRSVGRRPLALALALMAMLVRATRFEAWESRPTPATEFFGQEVRWSGEFDGTYFFANDPVRAMLALVAREGPPVGRLVLTATAEPAQGKRNPGGFDYAGYLKRRGVAGQLFVAEVL